MRKYKFLLLLTLSSYLAISQNDKPFQFEESEVETIESFIWNKVNAYTDYPAIPEEYQADPAVIIDQENYRAYKFRYANSTGTIFFDDVFRKVIKIQEEEAISVFNTLKFYSFNADNNDLIKIKVYKQDGSVKTYSNSDLIEDRDEEYNTYFKVALANIEVGDIIDYFFYTSNKFYTAYKFRSFNPGYILLVDDYPIMHQYYEFALQKNTYMITTSLNGAPQPKISELDEQRRRIELRRRIIFEDSMRAKVTEGARWLYPLRELPNIRFQFAVYRGASTSLLLANFFNAEDRAQTERTKEQLLAMFKSMSKGYSPSGKKIIKKVAAENLNTEEEKLQYVYNYARYKYYNEKKAIEYVGAYLEAIGVPYRWMVYVPRWLSPLDRLLAKSDLVYGVTFELEGKRYYMQGLNDNQTLGSLRIDGQDVQAYTYPGELRENRHNKDLIEKIDIPVTSYGENRQEDQLKVKIEGEQLIAKYQRNLYGNNKYGPQYNLLNYPIRYLEDVKQFEGEDEVESYDEVVEETYTISMEENEDWVELDDLLTNKERMKEGDRRALERKKYGFLRGEETDFTRNRRAYLANSIGQMFAERKVDSLKEVKVLSTGRAKTADPLSLETEFVIQDCVKKLGQNILIDAGMLIGGQVNLEDLERERDFPVYQDFPRVFMNHTEIEIPEGYSVEGLEKLNVNVDNEVGHFKATAELKDNVLSIKTEKAYKQIFTTTEDWPKLVSMLDAAFDFNQQKILLRKN